MKKYLLISLLAWSFFQVYAQKDTFVVLQSKYQPTPVLYIGIENPFDIYIKGVDRTKVKLSCFSDLPNGKILRHIITRKAGNFSVFLNDSIAINGYYSSQAFIKIDYPNSKNDFPILKDYIYSYEIKPLPAPRVSIGGVYSGEIRLDLFNQSNLTASHTINSRDFPCEIVKCKMLIIPKEGNAELYQIDGSNFNKSFKDFLNNRTKKLKVEDNIMIYDIDFKDGKNIFRSQRSLTWQLI